jgi:hypothetical protein
VVSFVFVRVFHDNPYHISLDPTNTGLNNQPLTKTVAPPTPLKEENVTRISSTTEAQLLQCVPRIIFKLKKKSFDYPKVRLISQNLRNTILPYWETVGSLIFHGKIMTLHD